MSEEVSYIDKIKKLIDKNIWILFLIVLLVGLYLRFYRIESALNFGWDQARDSWITRDLLMGKFTLIGPRTGIGHFHIGALYFYLLAPFYYVSNLDPAGANFLNIILNIVNFILIFITTKKIFNNYSAIFAISIYATNSYIIGINQVPWNVTLMPGVAALIFYSITKIYKNEYKWFYVLACLSGLYFHLHFTAIFLPFIIIFSLVFIKDKLKALRYALFSLPVYLVWFIPNLIYELRNHYSNTSLFGNFLNNYFLGFHFRFFLHRLPDAFLQMAMILNFPEFFYLRFIIPLIFLIIILVKRKDNKNLLFGYLISLWFVIPVVGFTFYSGPISEYYYLYDVPMVLYIIVYIHTKILQTRYKHYLFTLMIIFWIFYVFNNTKGHWVKAGNGGLKKQKFLTEQAIRKGKKIKFNEGDIGSYLYTIWKQDRKPRNL